MKNTLAENMRRFNTKNLNESHSIYSDALDTVIELGAILKLKDGTFVRVGAIPAKENPKYKTGMILVADLSRDARGPMTIDINNDVEEIYEKEHPIK
jgi:hypothetical protein